MIDIVVRAWISDSGSLSEMQLSRPSSLYHLLATPPIQTKPQLACALVRVHKYFSRAQTAFQAPDGNGQASPRDKAVASLCPQNRLLAVNALTTVLPGSHSGRL